MLLRRQLKTLVNLIKEYGLVVDATLVKSDDNKANQLTRAPQWWLSRVKTEVGPHSIHTKLLHIGWTFSKFHNSGHPQNKTHVVFCQTEGPNSFKVWRATVGKDVYVLSVNWSCTCKLAKRETWCGGQLVLGRSEQHSQRQWPLSLINWLQSVVICNLAAFMPARHPKCRTPVGVHILWAWPTSWDPNRQWHRIYQPTLSVVLARLGCTADSGVPTNQQETISSRETTSVKTTAVSKQFWTRGGLLVVCYAKRQCLNFHGTILRYIHLQRSYTQDTQGQCRVGMLCGWQSHTVGVRARPA